MIELIQTTLRKQFSNDLRLLILTNIVLFVLTVCFVANYKLFSLLITCYLTCLFTSLSFDYFISLCASNDDEALPNKTLAKFLFKNETLYKVLKYLEKINLRLELQKILNNKEIPVTTYSETDTSSELLMIEQLDEINMAVHINLFVKKISANFVESWYLPSISRNEQFPRETQLELEYLLNGIFEIIIKMNKLEFFAQIISLFNKSFLNLAILNKTNPKSMPMENIHPAIRNTHAEQSYMKRVIQLILRKSTASNFNLNHVIIEEFFMQLLGKNMIEKIIDLLTKPKFLFYAIYLLLDKSRKKKEKSKNELSKIETVSKGPIETIPEEDSSSESESDDRESDSFNSIEPEIIENNQVYYNTEKSIKEKFDHNLYQEFNEKNLNSFKSFTYSSSYSDSTIVSQVIGLKIINAETNYELKTGKKYTSYNITIEFRINNAKQLEKMSSEKFLASTRATIIKKVVKRRFKEFVTLQKKLEDNHMYRSFLKNIKSPSKFNLSIGNMEDNVIEKRRKKLDEYLNKLVKIPQICNSQELCLFLGNYNKDFYLRAEKTNITSSLSSSNLISNKSMFRKTFNGVIGKIHSPLSKANEMDKYDEISYEYSDHESADRIQNKFITLMNNQQQPSKHETDKKYKNEDKNDVKKSINKPKIHFSKNLLEIFNKLLITSTKLRGADSNFWFNNSKVYKLLEACFCDYYLERFFQDIFETILSEKNLIEYLHDLEDVLFADSNEEDSLLDTTSEEDMLILLKNTLGSLIPDIVFRIMGRDRLNGSLDLLLELMRSNYLNKHFLYCVLDLILYTLYQEDFIENL